ncbi:MAG: PQQ-dependent sugar dehydrogenase [Actinobacteria bacterium]|nr:PQQ-dependent sugar dehydrogenase [Actinomycetota bacterium]
MRHTAVVLLTVVAACSAQQELASTTTPEVATTETPSTTEALPSTTLPETTATIERSTTTTTLEPLESLAYEKVADLLFPVQLTSVPGSAISYIATKDGRIWLYDGISVSDEPVLDINTQVRDEGERGLLSIALHPVDPDRVFAHYTANNGDTVVSEFALIDDGTADPNSERVLLRLSQPAANHNGGMIQFGPDGILYVGLGDGGGANDRFDNGQNRGTLLGGLVSISVDGDPDPTLFNFGLRNPWRFWIDDDVIYIADVGQNAYEEVSVVELGPDINFGWPITEGLHCFRPSSGCDTTGLTPPVVEVSHGDAGTCSITGGVVYRGEAIPELYGTYFYSDYCGGYLRSFHFDGDGIRDETDWTEQVGVPGQVVGFGVDGEGEMYVVTTNSLLKLVAVRG